MNSIKNNTEEDLFAEEQPKVATSMVKCSDAKSTNSQIKSNKDFEYQEKVMKLQQQEEEEVDSIERSEHSSKDALNYLGYEGKNFEQHDIQQKAYEFAKNHDRLRISKDDGGFMKRMLLDVFIRQTKEQRLNELVEKSKVKIDENERIRTFNRLIEDANRRMEASDNLEALKAKLEEQVPGKKYSEDDWKFIYYERYIWVYILGLKAIMI
jgi:hypothetical protein